MKRDEIPRLASNRSPNWAFMQKFEVPDYDEPSRNYLTRWRILQTPWFGVYLHRFDGPDPRPTLHDHPWDFRSMVLRGGYVEATAYDFHGDLSEPRSILAGGFNVKRAADCHTIVKLLRVPTWTLMVVGRRKRVWGYLEPDGTWTRFDQHRYNDEFNAALEARKAPAPSGPRVVP